MSYNPQNPNGQATSANSEPVVIASDQSAVPVSAGSLPLPTGAATSADQTNGTQKTQVVDGSGNVIGSTSNALNVNIASGSVNGSSNITEVGGSAIALGNNTMSNSLPVTLASNDTNTAPFVASGGGGYIRQDSTGTIAKESGGNLATIAGAVSGGKMNVNLSAGSLPSGSNTIGSVEITDGTNTTNVVAGDSGFSGVATAAATKTYTFTTSASGAQVIGPYSCEGFSLVEIVYTSVGTGLANTGQFSTTTSGTYVSSATFGSSSGNLNSAVGTAANVIYYSTIHGNYFQINVTALTSGTFAGTVTLRAGYLSPGAVSVAANSATGSAVPGNAFYIAGTGTSGDLTGIQTGSAMADAASGTAALATAQYVFNGSSFDRTREATSASGTTGTGLLGAGAMGVYNSSTQTATTGNYYPLQLDANENLKVNVAAGSGLTVQPGNTPNTTPWLMSLQPATSGGWSVSSQTALTNTIVYAKTSAGQFGGYMFNNPNATTMYIQIFNAASGATLGTTAPTYVIPIPAAASANVEFANGIAHSAGIGLAVTTTATGSAAPTTALVGFIVYK